MTTMRAIYGAKREIGIEEDDYRSLLVRVTGKASLTLMNAREQGQVLRELRAKGAGSAKPRSQLAGPYGTKLQALWLSGWHLGVVRNNSDEALLAFVKGRTGIDHTRFLYDAKDARKAVEALKAWLARDASVDWNEFTDPKDCVIAAQCRKLAVAPGDIGYSVNGTPSAAIETVAKIAMMQILGQRIRDGAVA